MYAIRSYYEVEKMHKMKVSPIRKTFQTLSMPRRSWIIVEWTYALAVSHGKNAAFSTVSQAQ